MNTLSLFVIIVKVIEKIHFGSKCLHLSVFFILRCLRLEAYFAIFSHLDIQLTNQLEPVEESTNKTKVKGPTECELEVLNEKIISFNEK